MSNNESNDAKTMTALILELIDGLIAIALSGKGGSLRAMSLKGGYPDTRTDPKSKDVSDIKVSKAKATKYLKTYVQTAIDNASFCSDMHPDMVDTPAGLRHLREMVYTIQAGKNKGTAVNAWVYALLRVRRADKRAERSERRATAVANAEANGGAWFAEGVTDKEGAHVPYPSEKKAQKAWCRAHFGGEWFEPKSEKANRLAAAVVKQGMFTEAELARSGTAGTSDEAIIAEAAAMGSKAKTVKGAKAFLARQS